MCCPQCLSDRLILDTFDFGVDPETGYRDQGASFQCEVCGEMGDVSELVEMPVKIAPQSETQAPARVKESA